MMSTPWEVWDAAHLAEPGRTEREGENKKPTCISGSTLLELTDGRREIQSIVLSLIGWLDVTQDKITAK